jgi:hypothetical protein
MAARPRLQRTGNQQSSAGRFSKRFMIREIIRVTTTSRKIISTFSKSAVGEYQEISAGTSKQKAVKAQTATISGTPTFINRGCRSTESSPQPSHLNSTVMLGLSLDRTERDTARYVAAPQCGQRNQEHHERLNTDEPSIE